VGSRQVGLAASILVASCPVILNYSRSFHFSLPERFGKPSSLFIAN
jgi:hypothetical protein